MYLKNKFIIILIFLISCQPIETIPPVEIDNSKIETISISAKEKLIKNSYKSIFSEENIEDQLINPPIKIIDSWVSDNINNYGNQNKFIINILDASILKKEIENNDAKKYEEKTIFQYQVLILVEYELYDDNDYLLANTIVETTRSTTSQKYISLNETEIIINDLLRKALNDFVSETIKMTKLYMGEYL